MDEQAPHEQAPALTLGVAIYPGYGPEGSEAAITRLLEQAARHGYTEVFTSLHLPEASPAATAGLLERLAGLAGRLGLRLWADVAPPPWRPWAPPPATWRPWPASAWPPCGSTTVTTPPPSPP